MPTRAPKCILIKSPLKVLSHDVFTHDFKKNENEVKSHFKRGSFSFGNGLPSRLSTLNGLFIRKKFIPKYLANAHRFCSNFTNIEVAIY